MGMFNTFITTNGNIYPCYPLCNIEKASIGNINDDIEQTLVSNVENSSILQWLKNAPNVDMTTSKIEDTNFKKQCILHRKTFSSLVG